MDLVLKVKEIATEYELSNEIENQTIGEISKKMCKLKAECRDRIRSEKEININMYSEIKEEYKEELEEKEFLLKIENLEKRVSLWKNNWRQFLRLINLKK